VRQLIIAVGHKLILSARGKAPDHIFQCTKALVDRFSLLELVNCWLGFIYFFWAG